MFQASDLHLLSIGDTAVSEDLIEMALVSAACNGLSILTWPVTLSAQTVTDLQANGYTVTTVLGKSVITW